MFKKYSSLENHTNSKFLEKIVDGITQGFIENKFVAREKIHGTNFSVIITKDSITPAKRSGVIALTESFFGWQDLMAAYDSVFKEIQEESSLLKLGHSIQIFGEFAGGGIQKEVDYGEKEFYVFDIAITDDEGKTVYMADSDVTLYCCRHGLKMAPTIGYGTLEELLKLPVEFSSVVNTYNEFAAKHGINAANMLMFDQHKNENIGEGLVIKPNEPAFLPNGSRVAIKYKTDAFKEKGKAKAPKLPTPLTEKDAALFAEFSQFITWNRVSNVLSHIGEVKAKDFGKVMGLVMQDLFTEAGREGLDIKTADVPSKVQKEIQVAVTTTIRSKWQEVISQ